MAEYKARWLQWWNSSRSVHQSNHFPLETPFKNKTFDAFLNRASFWAHVFFTFLYFFLSLIVFIVLILIASYSLATRKGRQLYHSLIEAENTWVVNWNSPVGILGPKEFVDRWRILLKKKAFLPILFPAKGAKFVKGTDLRVLTLVNRPSSMSSIGVLFS